MVAGCLAISRSPGEGLRSLRQPYRRNKKRSYVYRLIWPAHLDDYPISNPISREKRIAGRFLPPPPLAGPWMPVVSWGGDVLEVGTQQARAWPSLSPRAGKPQRGGCALRNSPAGAWSSWLASDLPVGDCAGRVHVTLVLPLCLLLCATSNKRKHPLGCAHVSAVT